MTADTRFAGLREELVAGVLRGYRQWMVPANNPRLRCMGQATRSWPTTELTASCVHKDDLAGRTPSQWDLLGLHEGPAPDPECSCGIYGWYRPEDTEWTVSHVESPFVRVLGAIELRGKVLMGERGFRAQHARILGLWIPLQSAEYELSCITSFAGSYWGRRHVSFTNTAGQRNVWLYDELGELNQPPRVTYQKLRDTIAVMYPVPLHDTLESLCEQFPPDDLTELVPGLPKSRYDPRVAKEDAQRWRAYYSNMSQLSAEYLREIFKLQ